jgi:hypothetical protein
MPRAGLAVPYAGRRRRRHRKVAIAEGRRRRRRHHKMPMAEGRRRRRRHHKKMEIEGMGRRRRKGIPAGLKKWMMEHGKMKGGIMGNGRKAGWLSAALGAASLAPMAYKGIKKLISRKG